VYAELESRLYESMAGIDVHMDAHALAVKGMYACACMHVCVFAGVMYVCLCVYILLYGYIHVYIHTYIH
jgi:hypothetical protein